MNHQHVIFEATAPANVSSISLQHDIKRLLPQWVRPGVNGLLFVTIDDQDKSVHQERMKWFLLVSNPEEVMKGETFQPGKLGQEVS